jgi:hypothetical protein
MTKHIKVRAAPDRRDDDRAILNDQDEAHPDGHVLIKGTDSRAHTVGDTSRVRELIQLGALVVVEEKKDAPKEQADGSAAPKP